jgi:hypothetical protein
MLRHDLLPVIQLLLDLIHLFVVIFQALSGDPNAAVVFLPEFLLIQAPMISPEICSSLWMRLRVVAMAKVAVRRMQMLRPE